jgi:hypothetical protein
MPLDSIRLGVVLHEWARRSVSVAVVEEEAGIPMQPQSLGKEQVGGERSLVVQRSSLQRAGAAPARKASVRVDLA